MASTTTNLGLTKPDAGDKFSITGSEGYNNNMDKIDGAIGQLNSELKNKLQGIALVLRGNISGDLNIASSDKIPMGIYYYQSGNTLQNAPNGVNWGVFIQIGNGSYYFTQIIVDGLIGVKTRKYSGNPPLWSSWK